MKNPTKKAVIINDFTSPYIYQAIIILNEHGVENQSKALRDAEKIVSDYIKRHESNFPGREITLYSRPHKSSQKKYRFLKSALSIGTLISLLFIGFIFFGK